MYKTCSCKIQAVQENTTMASHNHNVLQGSGDIGGSGGDGDVGV